VQTAVAAVTEALHVAKVVVDLSKIPRKVAAAIEDDVQVTSTTKRKAQVEAKALSPKKRGT